MSEYRCGCENPLNFTVGTYAVICNIHKISWNKLDGRVKELEEKLNKAIEALEYTYDNENMNTLDYIKAVQIRAMETLEELRL